MRNKVGIYRTKSKTFPWLCRWYGDEDISGKRRRYGKAFSRKSEAESFKAEKTRELEWGLRDRLDDVTLQEFCEDWLPTWTKTVDLRPESVKLYRATIDRLYSHFGRNKVLTKLTRHSARKFIAEQKPLDSNNGEKLSSWTKHRILRNCRTMFECAAEDDQIEKNPFAKIRTPQLSVMRWHQVTLDEYQRLLSVAPTLRWRAFYALAYTTGLRFGELFNLTWSDIDFETNQVKVQNRPATETTPPFYVKDHESRVVPLIDHTVALLTELHAHAPEKVPYVLLSESQHKTMVDKWEKRKRDGKSWRNADMVNNVGREFSRHFRRAGIRPDGTLSIHTLRKSCCHNWVLDGNPMTVTKKLMGHSSIVTTQKFYDRVDPEQQAKVRDRANERMKTATGKTDIRCTLGADSQENPES